MNWLMILNLGIEKVVKVKRVWVKRALMKKGEGASSCFYVSAKVYVSRAENCDFE